MAEPKNRIAAKLREHVEKVAARQKEAAGEGAPDRMTVADGQGGITAEKKDIPHDVGEDEVKRDQPADGKTREAKEVPEGGPDRLTVADGQGGITATKGTVPKDPGEEEVNADLPADGETRKAAGVSERVSRLRDKLIKVNPDLAKSAGNAAPPAAGEEVVPDDAKGAEKAAGSEGAPTSEGFTIDASQETLAKVARVVLETDGGVAFVNDALEKKAGAEAARAQITEAVRASAVIDHAEQVKSAAIDELGARVLDIHEGLAANGLTDEDCDEILKQASVHQTKLASYEHPMLKQAYAGGMDDATLMAAADEAAGQEGVPPVDEAIPAGGEELGEEDVLMLIQEMINNGEITEEDLQEALAMAEGGAAPEGAEAVPAAA